MSEGLRPLANRLVVGTLGNLTFRLRLLLDLQLRTIYQELQPWALQVRGRLLDVGCGESPYRSLFGRDVTYQGVDVELAKEFGYRNPEVETFNGTQLPFPDAHFDAVLCTEVLEHSPQYQELVNEIYRVLKPDGSAFVTVPWSARFHYIPHDYYRYTPSALQKIFGEFTVVEIRERGNDLAVITNKLLVMLVRNLRLNSILKCLGLPLWVMLLPVLGLFFAMTYVSFWCSIRSGTDDPLGYTIILKK